MWGVVTMLPLMLISKWNYISLSRQLSVKWNRNYVWIHTNITSMKEKLTIIIKLSLGKRKIDYKRVNRLQSLEAKTTIKKKREEITYGFIFITSLSFGILVGWVEAVVEDVVPLPLRSSLVGIGRVANTTCCRKTLFPWRGLWGKLEAGWHHGPLPRWCLLPFQQPQATLLPWKGCWLEGELCLGFPCSAPLEAVSSLELKEPEAQRAGG